MSASKIDRERDLNVPVACLFQAITDFEKYPEFLKEVIQAEVLPGVTRSHAKVHFQLEVIKRFDYELEFRMKENENVKWELVSSNFFKQNAGFWDLKPIAGTKTQVRYHLEVGFGFFVPPWVAKKLTEFNLPQMFDSFENRALMLAKQTKGTSSHAKS